jgi:hypothetical protein
MFRFTSEYSSHKRNLYLILQIWRVNGISPEDFYRVAMAERALWIYSDDEKNLPETRL